MISEIKRQIEHLGAAEIKQLSAFCRELLKQKKPAKGASIGARAAETWKKVYPELTGAEYYWTAQDAQAMKLLIKKITSKLKEQNNLIEDNLIITSIEQYVRKVYQLNDKWYNDHFNVSLLNSHFNQLYLRLRKNKTNGKSGITESYKQSVLNDLLS